jgi:hypothetical protein
MSPTPAVWTAKCSYINKLLPPDEFHAKRSVVDSWIDSQEKAGILDKKNGLFPMEAHYVGRRRYEYEHWLGSHPDLRPCDVSKSARKDYWLEGDRDFSVEFVFDVAPRHNISAPWIWYTYTANNASLEAKNLRMRDYFLLRGMIYRWLAFYDDVPGADSWVWEWFPDGQIWLNAVAQYGGPVAINDVVGLPGKAEFEPPSESVQSHFAILRSLLGSVTYFL